MNTIELYARRMKRFEELLIDSGVIDAKGLRGLCKNDLDALKGKTKANKNKYINTNDNVSDND